MTPKERTRELCVTLDIPDTWSQCRLIEQAIECAMADAWDEGYRVRAENPYREDSVANATAKRDAARDAVVNWMQDEGMEGRLRYNDECPHWQAYIEAEENLKKVAR